MSEEIFRDQTIPLSGGQKLDIIKKPIREIFQFNRPPYLIIGSSTCGKTTIAIDLIYEYAAELTYIVFMTPTKVTVQNATLSNIPKMFIRKPSFEALNNVWREILRMNTGVNIEEEKLKALIIKLYENGAEITSKLDVTAQNILKEQTEVYEKQKKPNASELALMDSRAFIYDTAMRLLIDKIETVGTDKLKDEEMALVMSLVSVKPKVLLILDDMTKELADMQNNKNKVLYNGRQTLEKEAFESLLINILTTGRHSALVAMFVHSIDIFNKKEYLNNLVLLDKTSVQKIANARSYPENSRAMLLGASSVVFDAQYPYHFIHISMDRSDSIFVGKAKVRGINDKLNISPVMKTLSELYGKVLSNEISQTSTKISIMDESSEEEESGSDDFA